MMNYPMHQPRHQQLLHPMFVMNPHMQQQQQHQHPMSFQSIPMMNMIQPPLMNMSHQGMILHHNHHPGAVTASGTIHPSPTPIIFSNKYLIPNPLQMQHHHQQQQQLQMAAKWRSDNHVQYNHLQYSHSKVEDDAPSSPDMRDQQHLHKLVEMSNKNNSSSLDLVGDCIEQLHQGQSVTSSSPLSTHSSLPTPSNKSLLSSLKEQNIENDDGSVENGALSSTPTATEGATTTNITGIKVTRDGREIDECEYRTVCDRCTKMKVRCEKEGVFDSCVRCLKRGKGCVYSRKRTRREGYGKTKALRKIKGIEKPSLLT